MQCVQCDECGGLAGKPVPPSPAHPTTAFSQPHPPIAGCQLCRVRDSGGSSLKFYHPHPTRPPLSNLHTSIYPSTSLCLFTSQIRARREQAPLLTYPIQPPLPLHLIFISSPQSVNQSGVVYPVYQQSVASSTRRARACIMIIMVSRPGVRMSYIIDVEGGGDGGY